MAGDADAAAELHQRGSQSQRLGECRQHLVADHAEVGDAGLALEQHDELVATEPCHEIRGAQHPAQPPRHLPQQLVAGRVPERVVDRLEAVEIDEAHRERQAVAPGARDRPLDLGEEHVPVGQSGQAVDARQLLHLQLGKRGGRDVAADAAVALEAAVLAEHRLAADADPARLPVAALHPEVEVAEGEARRDAGLVVGERLRLRFEAASAERPPPADDFLGPDAGGTDDALRHVGEAQRVVLLPDPVGRERQQAAEPPLAAAQRFGAFAHVLLQRVAVGAQLPVQARHLLRRDLLRMLEQPPLLVVLGVGAAHARQQLGPRRRGRRPGVEPEAAQLPVQQRMDRVAHRRRLAALRPRSAS